MFFIPGMIIAASKEACKDIVEYDVERRHMDDIVLELPNDVGQAIEISRRVEELYKKEGYDVAIGISFNICTYTQFFRKKNWVEPSGRVKAGPYKRC